MPDEEERDHRRRTIKLTKIGLVLSVLGICIATGLNFLVNKHIWPFHEPKLPNYSMKQQDPLQVSQALDLEEFLGNNDGKVVQLDLEAPLSIEGDALDVRVAPRASTGQVDELLFVNTCAVPSHDQNQVPCNNFRFAVQLSLEEGEHGIRRHDLTLFTISGYFRVVDFAPNHGDDSVKLIAVPEP